MNIVHTTADLTADILTRAADTAARAIPPVWPLASFVAVNPFLGQASEPLAHAGARLARIAGTQVTMPRDWFAAQIADGRITDADLTAALARAPKATRPANPKALKATVKLPGTYAKAVPTIADLAAVASGTDWPGLMIERFGAWAAGFFDEGQALWAAPERRGAFAVWRETAIHDLTPEIAGLRGFAQFVADAPTGPNWRSRAPYVVWV